MLKFDKHLYPRGDTLIEVLVAITVFSAVAVGSLSIMNQGSSISGRSLEITLVRQEIDAQAEALRFFNSAYVTAYDSNATSYPSSSAAEQWRLISSHTTSAISAFGNNNTCPTTLASVNTNGFIINTHNATYIPSPTFSTSQTYSQVSYKPDGTFNSADGIWIEAIHSAASSDVAQATAKYIDFHIRACWQSPGQSAPVTVGTIVRLYEPTGNINSLIGATVPPVIPTFNLVVNAGAGGSVTGGGTYISGSLRTITATPDATHTFNSWAGDTGCIGDATNSHTIIIDTNKTCTASFDLITSVTYTIVGSTTITVPAGVTSVKLEAWGAAGGDSWQTDLLGNGIGTIPGAKGGYAKGTRAVLAGDILNVYVGGSGENGGWNGGGNGSYKKGGGASDVRLNGTGLGNRIIVAGGGGGGASWSGIGGVGGGDIGGNGSSKVGGFTPGGCGGFGGTQSAGGAPASALCSFMLHNQTAGTLGQGGQSNQSGVSGGGGGGYYGGGGGSGGQADDGGGGGGSSYTTGLSDKSTTAGDNAGDGKVKITWL